MPVSSLPVAGLLLLFGGTLLAAVIGFSVALQSTPRYCDDVLHHDGSSGCYPQLTFGWTGFSSLISAEFLTISAGIAAVGLTIFLKNRAGRKVSSIYLAR
jgi:hypothetical protein